MTSVTVWVAADDRGPSSLNVATDSRISWASADTTSTWDQARKVFAASTQPLIVGFLGDVLFPTIAIPTVIDRIDRGVFNESAPVAEIVVSAIQMLWKDFPSDQRRSQKIFLGERLGEKMSSRFRLTVMTHDGARDGRWGVSPVDVPNQSAVVVLDGSGGPFIRKSLALWQESPAQGTSRAIFSAFVESVAGGSDPYSGGAPQLGSLYRVGNGRLLGIVYGDRRYFSGAQLTGSEETGAIEWRNGLFEIADGMRKTRAAGAQRHEPR